MIVDISMQPYQFKDSEQQPIYRRLKALVGEGAAAFYKDACHLMTMDEPLESTTHLVSHLLREIESSLFSVLIPFSQPKIISNSNSRTCPSCGHSYLEPREEPSHPSHKEKIQAILKALDINQDDKVAKDWLEIIKKNPLHKQAHRSNLAPPRYINEEYRELWKKIQSILDAVLNEFETYGVAIRQKIDKLLDEKLTEQDINESIKLLQKDIPNSTFALGYFFDKLESPAWLKPLYKAGFFSSPPRMEIDTEAKTSYFPFWAQSRYLIKVAPHEPENVLAITTELLASNSNNTLIYQDIAKAALKMPSQFAACWVEKAVEWLKKQTYLYFPLPDTLGKLVNYLAHENQVDAAFSLAQELLAVLPQPEASFNREPITHFDEYYYNIIINEHLQLLVKLEPERILDLFITLLDRYLSLYLSDSTKREKFFEDHSSIWYSTFNSTSQSLYRTDRIDSILTGAIWSTTKQIAEQDPEQVKNLFRKFQNYRWRIFDRICLHLLRGFPNQVSDLIAERLTDRKRLSWLGLSPKDMESDYSREHALLLKEQFVNLSINLQEQIFRWLLEGPTNAMEVEVEQREKFVGYWQRDWFSVISDYLSLPCQQRYNELVRKLGAATTLGSNAETNAWSPNSPVSEVELAEMVEGNMSKFFAYLKPGELSELCILGLTTQIDELIAYDPQKFVDQIEKFKEIEPNLVISLPQGLTKALKQSASEHKKFSWEPVLTFCVWILEHFRELYDQNISSQEWSNLCGSIVSLIDTGLQAEELDKIPLSHRSQIWQLLKFLTSDTQVTPGFTPHYQDIYTDSRRAAVDTVRGKAMQAVVQYAFWIRQNANGNVQASQNFDDMPEVQQVLEWHLNPQQDPSSAIRLAYGKRFLRLLHLASNWTQKQIDQIFPEEPGFEYLFEAAWEGYTFNELYTNSFRLLRKKYKYAVGKLPALNSSSNKESETAKALSKKLVNLFLSAEIDLGGADSLLEDFFTQAPSYLHEEFMRHMSWQLLYNNFPIEDELRQRLQNFLEWRINRAKDSSTEIEQPSDLKYFGGIFASGKLDAQWAIAKLLDVLKLLKTVDDSREFLNRLKDLASVMPQEAVQCLSYLADGNQASTSKWFFLYPNDCHRAILQTALRSGDEVAQTKAKNLISRLLARNLGDFQELLL